MNYEDEDEEENKVRTLFENVDDDFLKFERIPKENRKHHRRDLCAFLYLDEKLGGNYNFVSDAQHDQIYLGFTNLHKLTQEDVLYITRCGVGYDGTFNSLYMFT